MMSLSLRTILLALFTALLSSSLTAQADSGPLCSTGCKDTLSKPGSSSPPASASQSWRFSVVRGWSKLTSTPGLCSGLTPSGCGIARRCQLTTTKGTFKLVLKSKLPTGGGTTGPVPAAAWGAPDPGSSPPTWTFTVSKSNPKEVNCGSSLDLSITWRLSGTPMSWTLKLVCSSCPGAEGDGGGGDGHGHADEHGEQQQH